MKTTVLILCGLFSVMSTLSALPAAAADLKAKRDAKVAEIDRVYAAELDKLQRRLMADGNLASANEVENEIKRVSVNPFADEKPKVEGTRWKWGSGGELALEKNGKAEHSKWSKPGKWTAKKDGSIVLKSDSGNEFVVTFESDEAAIVSVDGKAGTRLTKMK